MSAVKYPSIFLHQMKVIIYLNYSYINKKNPKGNKKFELLKTVRRQAQKSPRYVAPGTEIFSRFLCRRSSIELEPYCNIEGVNV